MTAKKRTTNRLVWYGLSPTGKARWFVSRAAAREAGYKAIRVDIPTTRTELVEWLNTNEFRRA